MPSKSQEPQQQTDTQHTDSFAWPCDPGPPDLFSWPILSPHTSASTCHCFPPSGDHCNTPKEDKPPPPQPFSQMMERKEKRGSNLDLVSSFPFHLMVFPDLKRWPSLSNWIFPVLYTLDFRKCTKQDSTAQRISCVSFPFFVERDKNTWETSDISSQGCSV